MNRIAEAFAGGKALIPFITCGDPSLEVTEELVYALEEAGADLIELGIPFSDPTAEGPVIQAANTRALSGGVTTDLVFEMAERIRRHTQIPLACMAYANVVFSYRKAGKGSLPPGEDTGESQAGIKGFIRRAAAAGIDALILPDVPFEEREEFAPVCRENEIAFVPLIAPSPRERISRIAKEAEGFLYCVSSPGVTGVHSGIIRDVEAMVKQVKQEKEIPCAAGFDGSTLEQIQNIARVADGVMTGSAIVKICGAHGTRCVPYVKACVKEMKEAIRSL